MKVLRGFLPFLFLLVPSLSQAQIDWLYDAELAKSVAVQKDQLILMDFWATWCGPCRAMDRELWTTDEAAKLAERFVPLKIDIDSDRAMAMKYNARSIPLVVLMTASGEVVWQQLGYSNPNMYLRVLEQIPENLSGLNAKLVRPDLTDYEIGLAYQAAGSAIDNSLGQDLLDLSSEHFRKAAKSDDPETAALAELNQILNYAYSGRYKKVIKQLEKNDFPDTERVSELKSFVEAFCYKCQGDDENYEAARTEISNADYIEKLESIEKN